MNYTIVSNDTQACAFRDGMGLPEIQGITGIVLQQVIDIVNSPSSQGGTITLIGFFNLWGQHITICNCLGNNQKPTSTLIICGNGNTTLLFNGLPAGTNAITIKEGACVDFRNLTIAYVQPEGGSTIRVEKGNGEVACWKGVFHDLLIRCASTNAYAFYAENFFNFDFQRVVVECESDGLGSLHLYNNSVTTNFGNSKFQNLSLLTPNRIDGAALKISSIDQAHPMNLNSFDVLNIGSPLYGPGQGDGKGIWMDGAAYTTFTHVDIEYIPSSIYLQAARVIKFLSGYIHPDGNTLQAIGIYCSGDTNGCEFNLEVDADHTNAIVVLDSGIDKEPNTYHLSLSGSACEDMISVQQRKDCVISLRQNGSGNQTSEIPSLKVKRFNLPVGNNSPVDNDIWIENGEVKVQVNGIIKTVAFK